MERKLIESEKDRAYLTLKTERLAGENEQLTVQNGKVEKKLKALEEQVASPQCPFIRLHLYCLALIDTKVYVP